MAISLVAANQLQNTNIFPLSQAEPKHSDATSHSLIAKIADQAILSRQESEQYLSLLEKGSLEYTELSQKLLCHQAGIHQLESGLKINLTACRLRGGFVEIGAALIGILTSDTVVGAVKGAGRALWNKIFKTEVPESEEAMRDEVAIFGEKLGRVQEDTECTDAQEFQVALSYINEQFNRFIEESKSCPPFRIPTKSETLLIETEGCLTPFESLYKRLDEQEIDRNGESFQTISHTVNNQVGDISRALGVVMGSGNTTTITTGAVSFGDHSETKAYYSPQAVQAKNIGNAGGDFRGAKINQNFS